MNNNAINFDLEMANRVIGNEININSCDFSLEWKTINCLESFYKELDLINTIIGRLMENLKMKIGTMYDIENTNPPLVPAIQKIDTNNGVKGMTSLGPIPGTEQWEAIHGSSEKANGPTSLGPTPGTELWEAIHGSSEKVNESNSLNSTSSPEQLKSKNSSSERLVQNKNIDNLEYSPNKQNSELSDVTSSVIQEESLFSNSGTIMSIGSDQTLTVKDVFGNLMFVLEGGTQIVLLEYNPGGMSKILFKQNGIVYEGYVSINIAA